MLSPAGELVAASQIEQPTHISALSWSAREVLARYGDDIGPGDLYLHNDPYTGGSHLNDVGLFYPVFHHDRPLAIVAVMAHCARRTSAEWCRAASPAMQRRSTRRAYASRRCGSCAAGSPSRRSSTSCSRTIERGYDPARFTLVPFGGAGPMHATHIAAELGMRRGLVPLDPGNLSALGTRARASSSPSISPARRASPTTYATRSSNRSARQYGHAHASGDIEIVNLRTTVIGVTPKPQVRRLRHGGKMADATLPPRDLVVEGKSIPVSVYERERLPVDVEFEGPAVIEEAGATTVMLPRWRGRRDDLGNLRFEAVG